MSDLKDYEVRTTSGYVTTIQYSDADAKLRGLLGKDVDAESAKASGRKASQAAAKKKAAEDAAAKKAAEAAEAAAKEKAAAEAAAGAKGGPVPANKQAPPPADK
ncbi:hypothetical protein [Arthrobacter sp.]|uniref:hypothetical protein n=1 Tax=Arthrobacter sp. TaxID=1667 RepID=UPI003A9511B6